MLRPWPRGACLSPIIPSRAKATGFAKPRLCAAYSNSNERSGALAIGVLSGPTDGALLTVTDLQKHFPIRAGVLVERTVGAVKAVDGVSFHIDKGETLGLVGE